MAEQSLDTLKTPEIEVNVEFTGGLEMLFRNRKKHVVSLPITGNSSEDPPTIAALVQHLTDAFLSQSPKKDLFVLDGAVRPGILVLVNDADYELEGGENRALETGDNIVFVSTLHGG